MNVTGIRRQESAGRAKMPVSKLNPGCANKGGIGMTWNAIMDWDINEVFAIIDRRGLKLHEGYTRYGMQRISCVACIMASGHDLRASMSCEDNQPAYRLMVDLELTSTFSFQSNKWLADVNPEVLGPELAARIEPAKTAGAMRERAEARIPKHLLFQKGWPSSIPTQAEAEVLAEVRCEVASLLGIEIQYTDAKSIIERFSDLMAKKPVTTDTEGLELIPVVNVSSMLSTQLGLF